MVSVGIISQFARPVVFCAGGVGCLLLARAESRAIGRAKGLLDRVGALSQLEEGRQKALQAHRAKILSLNENSLASEWEGVMKDLAGGHVLYPNDDQLLEIVRKTRELAQLTRVRDDAIVSIDNLAQSLFSELSERWGYYQFNTPEHLLLTDVRKLASEAKSARGAYDEKQDIENWAKVRNCIKTLHSRLNGNDPEHLQKIYKETPDAEKFVKQVAALQEFVNTWQPSGDLWERPALPLHSEVGVVIYRLLGVALLVAAVGLAIAPHRFPRIVWG